MSWRDELRDASFRGVAFFVDSAEAEHGRRTVLHEYPQRDKPYAEDLGRRSRMYFVEAIVLGDEYMAARDALLDAVEQPGAGKLVHPYYGELQVSLTDPVRVRETTTDGGMARITLAFVEAGDITYPSATADTRAASGVCADASIAAAQAGFADRFSIAGLPDFVSQSALDTISGVLATVGELARYPLGDILQRGLLDGLLNGLGSTVLDLLDTPLTLGASLAGVVAALGTTAPDPASATTALTQLAAFVPTPALPTPTTATRTDEYDNQTAIVELVRVCASSEAVRAVADAEFDSYDQAIALRDSVTDAIDVVLDATTDDVVYQAVSALRAAVVRDVAARGGDLARIARYTPPGTLPAIVLAYGLYDDPLRDVDILTRNAIMRPGFVPGGQPIQVLLDA